MKDLKNDLFLRACHREPVERTPIWLMRQAGRYMPEYRALREKAGGFVAFYKNVELAVEATVLPRKILGVDASIIFSDILTPLESIGMDFEFKEGEGPVFYNPIEKPEDINRLKPFDRQDVYYVGEIIKGVNRALNREIPTIGFCGAPFTLAAYMIEGRTSKDFKKAKTFMYNYPDAFKELLDRLADMLIEYLNFQIESGADAVQIFDSWGGYLSPDDYREFALPPIKKIIKGLKRDYQPVIHFTKGVAGFFDDMITSGADVYGVDWMIDLSEVKEKLDGKAAAQGNLDPVVLYAEKDVIREKAVSILRKWGKDTGHIFNLGHGLMPDMEVEKVKYLVDVVKKESVR
ncbi:uroporphyrinogen decarboxylase [Persephonella hydrogeniphila]|uniref:Uroporphyrinogen decarboxylase n=1 Tax=Persephonella hydrogeniphila TaxID=198703 RepID=A0A285N387_9AQUI|nr:uroporphyrinogen decarboxylase [Persephonella hydrogeniphila]SNZ02456.1 uroporphyrinogen decarboxylase [Persephonella hydrogeniphila]